MFYQYLELISTVKFLINLIISINFKLKPKYYYLLIIECVSIILLTMDYIPFLQTIGIVICMSNIYGTLNDIIYGWFSPEYWRESHYILNPFPLNQSNYDNNPRTFYHAFFWGFYGTWKYSLILGGLNSFITTHNQIDIEVIIQSYFICFYLMLGLSFQHFSIIKNNVPEESIPFHINNFGYQIGFFFNTILMFYFFEKNIV